MNDLSHHKQPTEKQPITSANLMMSDLVELAEADQELTPHRKRDVVSAVRSICGHLGLDPALTPASHAYFRRLFAKAHPKQMGLTRKTFQNLRSAIGFALARYVAQDDRRGRKGLLPEWQELWDRLTDYEMKFGMSRFLRYCSDLRIVPEAVTVNHAEAFLEYLQNQTLVEQPEALHRRCLLAWNKAVDTVAGWPQTRLTIPSNRETYCLAWDDLPESFRQDAEAWLAHLANADPFSLDGPIRSARPATIKTRRFQVRQLVSALVQRGHDLSTLKSLADLVQPSVAKQAIRFFYERKGNATSSQVSGLARVIHTIAKHWCKLEGEPLTELSLLKRRLNYRIKGLTEKNRERLRQLADERNILALLSLPQTICDHLQGKNGISIADALEIQVAVAVELLLMMPIRRANLVRLRFGPNGHIRPGQDRKGKTHIVIPGDEVKNTEDLEYPLPRETADVLEVYIERFRPQLTNSLSYWLFPGEGPAGHKTLDQFSRQFTKIVREWTGLEVNIHLMRHIGVKLYLDHNPGAYEVVRRVLGHRSLSTTVNSYTGLETESAVRHFDSVILGIRDALRNQVGDREDSGDD